MNMVEILFDRIGEKLLLYALLSNTSVQDFFFFFFPSAGSEAIEWSTMLLTGILSTLKWTHVTTRAC